MNCLRGCLPRKEERQVAEKLRSVARSRQTVAAVLMREAKDEKRLAAAALREGAQEEARQHVEAEKQALAEARREYALYKNAAAMAALLDRAAVNRELGALLSEGGDNLQRVLAETPELAEVVDRIRELSQQVEEHESELDAPLLPQEEEKELELPDVPRHKIASPQRVRVAV